MSFADIINQEQKKLEQNNGGNNEGVKYPQTKNKRLFYEKGQKDVYLQVLPSADLYSQFTEPVRKIFLSCKSSKGKEINSNFTLDAEANPGSLLEQKVTEWAEKGMIPNGFGGQQSPRRLFLVNAVKIIQNPANPQQFIQERDAEGNLVVRVFEMPQSAYQNYLRKLGDPLYNTSGSELSFMDINKPALVKVSKPAKGQMEYPVEVYTNVALPPLGQGWENQLEDLKAQAVPTERLENGYDWVKAFVDMKEGRKPSNSNDNNTTAPTPNANPFANPFANLGGTPTPNPADLGNIGTEMSIDVDGALQNLQPNPTSVPTPTPTQAYTPATPDLTIPTPTPTPAHVPTPGAVPTPTQNAPTHNVGLNDNGLLNIDAMLEAELNGGN